MSICFKLGTAGWNCVTKGKIRLGSFCFFSKRLFSSFVFYFGEDIFHKVNWVASLGQTFFKLFISSSNDALEEVNLLIHKPSIGYIVNPKGKRAQYYTSTRGSFKNAKEWRKRQVVYDDPDNTIAHPYCA